MSALHPELQGALAQLLQGLNSPDNELRTKYEEALANEWQAQKPDALLMGLVEHAHAAQDEKVALLNPAQLVGTKICHRCDRLRPLSSEE